MPKEVIQDQAHMYDLQIGWQRDKWVQVGLETHNGSTIASALDAEGDPHAAATFTGLWGTLDRAGVNRAIRMLRKARDEAFGRDE